MTRLSESQVSRVATLLHIQPADPRLDKMIAVIDGAISAQGLNDGLYQNVLDTGTKGNSLYNQSQDLIEALKTAQQTLAEMPEHSTQLLDVHYDSANKDNVQLAIKPDEMELWKLAGLNGSGVAVLVDRMVNAATSAAEDVTRHGPGQGTPARNYTPALMRLADGFEPMFPDLKVEARANSPFYRLCDYFLNKILEPPAGIYEIKGQIKKMIKVRNELERK